MSMICDEIYRCGLCGCEFTGKELYSTHEYGSPDLDLRPAEEKRYTMDAWVQCCPNCGYVSRHIEKDGTAYTDFVRSEIYRTCEGNTSITGLAQNLYRYGLLCLKKKKYNEAYDAFIWSAWDCDDEERSEEARVCRNRAALVYYQNGGFNDPEIGFVNVDVLRRAGRFKEAIKLCKSLDLDSIEIEEPDYDDEDESDEDYIKKAVRFQLMLCRIHNTNCYSFNDFTGPISKRLLNAVIRIYDRRFPQEDI